MATDELSRRKFLKASGIGGTALLLGFYFPANAREPKMVTGNDIEPSNVELKAWIIINTLGKVTLVSHRAEMGQGAYQSIAQILAEELEVDLNDVDITFGQGDKEKYGDQITGGSSTIRGSYKNLLNLSASAREMLIAAAATKWAVPHASCYAKSGHVFHKPSGKKFHYGELVVDASRLDAPKNIVLKKRSEYKLIGKPLLRKDTPMKTDGSAIFGLDKRLPGMLFAVVERNPRLRGVVKSYDDSDALKVPGVKKVFKVRMAVHTTYREGIAVVADNTWAAMQGKKALKVQWDDTGFDHVNTAGIYQRQGQDLKTRDGLTFKTQGDATGVLEKAEKKIDVIYQTPYQSHSAMEPVNCVAHYYDNKIEIWGPIQAPEWVQEHISKEMKVPYKDVTVNMTFLGGGFGRKAFTDYPHEAVLISKEMGAPVLVTWSREDDITQGPHRPGISYRCEGAVTNGEISALKVKLSGQNINHWMGGKITDPNDSAGEGFLKPYFNTIKNISIHDVPFETPLPVLWWRSVYASTNGFAYESIIDELAHAANKDPLEFRKQHLKDARVQRQLDKLAEVSGWQNRKKNEGYGVAITECFETPVAQVVKVSKKPGGGITVDHVWAVVDCGWYVNPDIIKAQVEGSIIMALGAATIHEITFTDGLVDQKNFYNYPMPRITDTPLIDVYIMENDAEAGGVGEPGLPAFAPALTNAIFDLTGKRIRKLPFSLNAV